MSERGPRLVRETGGLPRRLPRPRPKRAGERAASHAQLEARAKACGGRRRGSPPASRTTHGFTLLEVVVVLFVVALGAAVVLPRVEAARGVVVDVEARRVADAMAFGRERAILSGATMRLVIAADGRSWQLGRPGKQPGSVLVAETDAAPVGPPTRLAADVSVRTVSIGGVSSSGSGIVVVDLQPDGDALAVQLVLADARGRAATVVLPPAGRRPVVVPGARA